ncbi:MAG: hypothetical protein IPG92_00125 [Flavobacteriales bacterium]|nr:hypothetical protein [Flavobacteriales bacterium]
MGGGFTTFNGTARNRLVRLFTGCDDTVQLVLKTDGFGAQTSWETIGEGFTYTICSGTGFASNQEITATCCFPWAALRLRVLDSAGDGMTTGGYECSRTVRGTGSSITRMTECSARRAV